jgi:hypothetical protein
LTRVVLLDPSLDIAGYTNVKLAVAVLENVNAISHRDWKRLVAGAGFEPATFRL